MYAAIKKKQFDKRDLDHGQSKRQRIYGFLTPEEVRARGGGPFSLRHINTNILIGKETLHFFFR